MMMTDLDGLLCLQLSAEVEAGLTGHRSHHVHRGLSEENRELETIIIHYRMCEKTDQIQSIDSLLSYSREIIF